MGTYTRGKLPHLTSDIISQGWAYQAFQALYLLETSLDLRDQDEEALARFVSVAPAAELSFPAGDIRRCVIDSNGRFRLELNLLGFYGVNSPLPQYFNDITSRDGDGHHELRAFLECFNKRLYSLAYLAWKKFNLFEDNNGQASIYTRYLAAISGGADENHAYAGILGSRIKSAQGLAATLEDFLGFPTRIQENIPCWIPIEQPSCLGQQLGLGDNTILGEQLMDVGSKIAIFVGPLPIANATELLPGRPLAEQLGKLLREYLDPSISYELELIAIADRDYQTILGNDSSILGWTSCLGEPGATPNHIRLTTTGFDRYQHAHQPPEANLATAA